MTAALTDAVLERIKVRDAQNTYTATFGGLRASCTAGAKAAVLALGAKPYLPFLGGPEDAKLQPQAEASVLSAITRYIDALGEA